MHKDGVVNSAVSVNSSVSAATNTSAAVAGSNKVGDSTLECSTAVTTLTKQFPAMIKSYLMSLPACGNVDVAIEEVRVLIAVKLLF